MFFFCFCKELDPHQPRNRARPRAVGEYETSLFAVARDSSEMSALVPQEHQIRMRSDERNKRFTSLVVSEF